MLIPGSSQMIHMLVRVACTGALLMLVCSSPLGWPANDISSCSSVKELHAGSCAAMSGSVQLVRQA